MAKHSDATLRNNAIRGAWTRYCPTCKRKAALGQLVTYMGLIPSYRICRYCGAKWETRDLPAERRKAKGA